MSYYKHNKNNDVKIYFMRFRNAKVGSSIPPSGTNTKPGTPVIKAFRAFHMVSSVVLLRYYDMHSYIGTHLKVTIKYAYTRGNTAYWQRKIPTDLRHRYPSSGTLKVNLHTLDPVVIASKVATLNRRHEAIWKAMRKDLSLSPVSAREEARKLLKSFGIEDAGRDTDEATLDAFYSALEDRRVAHATRQAAPEEAYHFTPDEDYLSKPEIEALKMLQDAPK